MSTVLRVVTGTVERRSSEKSPPVTVEHGDGERVLSYEIRESQLTQFTSSRKTHDFRWSAVIAKDA